MALNVQSEVLVIGSGIAGAVAALELGKAGVTVALVTRSRGPEECNTYYAQGGIIFRGDPDSSELLEKDILQAGSQTNQKKAVEVLAEQGPELVQRLLIEALAVPFDRNESGGFFKIREAAHSVDRILHVADQTGMAIEKALLNALSDVPAVKIYSGHTAIDLITTSHHSLDSQARYRQKFCVGAYCLDRKSQQVRRFLARKVILASGGLGQLFLHTSNPAGARGDGLAMAYRSGAQVLNCEFIQFHPTTFFHPQSDNFLISEAVRGAGARLVNNNGEPFMEKYSPSWKDLAPRDITARSIYREMFLNGVTNMFLDATTIGSADTIRRRFPGINQYCLGYKVDITTDLIPIVPAAHYFCGGVLADDSGRSTIPNLYAIGEVSCTGVHGANRLASASLLEGLVWGVRSARDIHNTIADCKNPAPADYPEWQYAGHEAPDQALITQDYQVIRQLMWNYVGLIRTTPRLERALRELNHLVTQIEQFYRNSRVTDELIGLRNAVLSALLITRSANANHSSVGCHYRE